MGSRDSAGYQRLCRSMRSLTSSNDHRSTARCHASAKRRRIAARSLERHATRLAAALRAPSVCSSISAQAHHVRQRAAERREVAVGGRPEVPQPQLQRLPVSGLDPRSSVSASRCRRVAWRLGLRRRPAVRIISRSTRFSLQYSRARRLADASPTPRQAIAPRTALTTATAANLAHIASSPARRAPAGRGTARARSPPRPCRRRRPCRPAHVRGREPGHDRRRGRHPQHLADHEQDEHETITGIADVSPEEQERAAPSAASPRHFGDDRGSARRCA